jgi:hypothetical protein
MKKLHTSMTLEKFDSSVCLLKNPLEVDGKKGQHVVDRIELVRKKNWLPGEGRAASERSEKVVRSEESQDTDRKDSQRDVLSDERPTNIKKEQTSISTRQVEGLLQEKRGNVLSIDEPSLLAELEKLSCGVSEQGSQDDTQDDLVAPGDSEPVCMRSGDPWAH